MEAELSIGTKFSGIAHICFSVNLKLIILGLYFKIMITAKPIIQEYSYYHVFKIKKDFLITTVKSKMSYFSKSLYGL